MTWCGCVPFIPSFHLDCGTLETRVRLLLPSLFSPPWCSLLPLSLQTVRRWPTFSFFPPTSSDVPRRFPLPFFLSSPAPPILFSFLFFTRNQCFFFSFFSLTRGSPFPFSPSPSSRFSPLRRFIFFSLFSPAINDS